MVWDRRWPVAECQMQVGLFIRAIQADDEVIGMCGVHEWLVLFDGLPQTA